MKMYVGEMLVIAHTMAVFERPLYELSTGDLLYTNTSVILDAGDIVVVLEVSPAWRKFSCVRLLSSSGKIGWTAFRVSSFIKVD